MSQSLVHRSVSFCLAAAGTIAMLGGVDRLAQHDGPAPQWAQQSAPRA